MSKLVSSLREAVALAGLRDGMTVSFHHHLRNGDYVLNMVMEEIARLGLDQLRFGDLVLLQDCDNTHGRGYFGGASAIGVVIHSDCVVSGHGPGISTILACHTPKLQAKIDPESNLLKYHQIAVKQKG